ncbi:type II toxin-antitoxin system VapB family antitoxin [uncultured Jatrophihabitans sp.]|uniref:type II toxin-antitoxin system VapB family antitoxin n=1 Tax=uncultured Jatrophihabitans sp. TaxID=1610747 RepID=UPI0035CA6A25
MTRTNVDIDDELIGEIMSTYGLNSKREAVDFALRKARRRRPMTRQEMLAMEGIGWEGNLDQIKGGFRPAGE